GDDPLLDVDAAKDLGIHAIWMDRGNKSPGERSADKIITHITELPNAIQEIVQREP
ncbi:MAG: FMN phosphatase YigB (HAD superfamily), partial [Candidatus Azotimanducaceae bacterium]